MRIDVGIAAPDFTLETRDERDWKLSDCPKRARPRTLVRGGAASTAD